VVLDVTRAWCPWIGSEISQSCDGTDRGPACGVGAAERHGKPLKHRHSEPCGFWPINLVAEQAIFGVSSDIRRAQANNKETRDMLTSGDVHLDL
jgi:hypothetical protein